MKQRSSNNWKTKSGGWDIWGNELDNDIELETSANNGR
jgi:hypothetical protein